MFYPISKFAVLSIGNKILDFILFNTMVFFGEIKVSFKILLRDVIKLKIQIMFHNVYLETFKMNQLFKIKF